MSELLYNLFGAVFTVAVATALGSLLLSRLRAPLARGEAALIAFVSGAGLLSFVIALLCVLHQARRGVFLWMGMVTLVLSAAERWRRSRSGSVRRELPAIPLAWLSAFWIVFVAFGIYYLVNTLAPEVSPDGSGYHLGNVARIWRDHGFPWDYRSMYSYLSQGTEMLFLMAYSFGRHPAAALVHLTYLCTLPLLIICTARRFGCSKAGLFAAAAVFVSPVVGRDGTSAYNDLAVVTLIYAVFHLLQVWDQFKERNILVLIGLLSGAAYAAKYTAFLALPFALIWVLREKQARWQRALLIGAPAALLIAPWVVRNWIWVGNPFAPFLNAWFPNPYVHTGAERSYAELLRHYYEIKNNWEIPLQLTLRGGLVGGALGPVFLLAPYSLLALRLKFGRKLLIAAAVFALPAWLNVGSRFLIPSLPFVAFALGLALSEIPAALPAVGLFHVLLCWPSILNYYCDPWNWRLSSFPLRVALHEDRPEPYIRKTIPDYDLRIPIELSVPRGQRIFTFAGRPDAYLDRDIVVSYESTLGDLVQDILWTPQGHLPSRQQRFKFLPVTTRAIRVVNTASGPDYWTIAELRLYYQGKELPRLPGWKLSASPNGSEVQLAFDNSYATRWSTWQGMSPGDRIEVEFRAPQLVDQVDLECDPTWKAKPEIQMLDSNGRWIPLTNTPEWLQPVFPSGIRRAATNEVKALGFHYILLNEGDMVYQDMSKFPTYWGVREIFHAHGTHFYHLD
jgi:hypothetical protein